MTPPPRQDPGRPDLTQCDREPIHLLGDIQSFGWAIQFSRDWGARFVSANWASLTGREPQATLGADLDDVLPAAIVHPLRNEAAALPETGASRSLYDVAMGSRQVDITLFRLADGFLAEFEPAQDDSGTDAGSLVSRISTQLQRAAGADRSLFDTTARMVRMVTGYDRVMVYRFADDGSGEVVSEAKAGWLEPFLGLHYPATDIPQQARSLYLAKTIRIIADVGAAPVPMLPPFGPGHRPIDLTYSNLRSVSPVHIEYLRNMGVGASLSISIVVDGALWGLIACHHYTPKTPSAKARAAIELIGQFVGLLVSNRVRIAERQAVAVADALQERLGARLLQNTDFANALQQESDALMQALGADAMFVRIGQNLARHGQCPDEPGIGKLLDHLIEAGASDIHATRELATAIPWADRYGIEHCGMLAIPLSRRPRDYLVFLRRELVETVHWAGNPDKVVEREEGGVRLSPRKSFAAWQAQVRGKAAPWSGTDLRIARMLNRMLVQTTLTHVEAIEGERARAFERQELLIAELNHRVRNILSLVRSLIGQTDRGTHNATQALRILDLRIGALARAHDQITRENWSPGSLLALVRGEFTAFNFGGGERLRVVGRDVAIQANALTDLALIIHELTTNAAKYGALCDSSGYVRLTLTDQDNGDLVFEWAEVGGPMVKPPTHRGFGSTVIEKIVPHSLGGDSKIMYRQTGVVARLLIPARHIARDVVLPDEPDPQRPADPGCTLSGDVLVVEDNLVIAMTAEQILTELGARDVTVVGNANDALHQISARDFEVVLLDVNLGDHTSLPVAERLADRHRPFVFCTGYNEKKVLPEPLASRPVLTKPYTRDDLARMLARTLAGGPHSRSRDTA